MTRLLENKVAVVSGSSQGLGLAIAMALVVDGAKVTVVSRSEGKAAAAVERLKGLGGECTAWVGDLLEDGSAEKAVGLTAETFGGVDIAVNAAGHFVWKPFMELTPQDWRLALDTNLTTAFHLTQSAARVMVDQGRGGAVVNIGSVHGSFADPNVIPQCASKFGVVGLTLASAEALRPFDIRVNAISPGSIEPDSAQIRGESPRHRVTQADIAALVVYLSSDFARTITATVVGAYGSTRALIKP